MVEQGANLDIEYLGHHLAVIITITEGDLRGLGPLEIEVHVVVPGEANATVDLNALTSNVLVDIATPGLGHGSGRG